MEIVTDLLGKGILIPALGAIVGAVCSAVVNRKPSGGGGGGGSSIANSIRGDGNTINNNLANSNNSTNVTHNHVHHHGPGKAAQGEAGGIIFGAIGVAAVLCFVYSVYARTIIFWVWEGGQFVAALAAAFVIVGAIMRTRPIAHWLILAISLFAFGWCGYEVLLSASHAYDPQWAYSASQQGVWRYFFNVGNDFRIYVILQALGLVVLVLTAYAVLRLLFTYRPNVSSKIAIVSVVLISVFLGISYFCATGQAYSMLVTTRQ